LVRYPAIVAWLVALMSITLAAEPIEIKIGYLRVSESKAASTPPQRDRCSQTGSHNISCGRSGGAGCLSSARTPAIGCTRICCGARQRGSARRSLRNAVVDGVTHKVTKYLLVGQRVWHMAFTPDEKFLLSTNGLTNDVSSTSLRSG
jgi:hypothetical protein